MRILLLEDDLMLGDAIQSVLASQSIHVVWLKDGKTAVNMLKSEMFDLIILDLGLPVLSGSEVLKRMRALKFSTPVLILTARDNITDKVNHLNMGADDYLVKPFDMDELNARIHCLVRRSAGAFFSKITHHDITLDLTTNQIIYQGASINLPRREYIILQELLINIGKVLSKEKLEQLTYGLGNMIGSNAIEVHIHHLRAKFYPSLIRTVRGLGYIIEKNA